MPEKNPYCLYNRDVFLILCYYLSRWFIHKKIIRFSEIIIIFIIMIIITISDVSTRYCIPRHIVGNT